jgi:ankyrin repeat protein
LIIGNKKITSRLERKNMNTKTLLILILFPVSLFFSGCGLHGAAKNGDIGAAKFWLATGSGVDSKDIGAQTPLIRAILNDQTEMAKFLVEKGADVNKIGESPATPIMLAAHYNNKELVEFLIENGAKVQFPKGAYRDRNGAALNSCVVGSDDIGMAQLFLDNGADVNHAVRSVTPLLQSIYSKKYRMAKFLLEKDADVNIATDDGNTPLHAAVKNANLNIVKLLIEKGANVNAEAKREGYTPLNYARDEDIEKYLISRGAIMGGEL